MNSPEVSPSSTRSCPDSTKVERCRPTSDFFRLLADVVKGLASSTDARPDSSHFGPGSAKLRRCCPTAVRFRSNSVRIRPTSVDFGRVWRQIQAIALPEFVRLPISANLGRKASREDSVTRRVRTSVSKSNAKITIERLVYGSHTGQSWPRFGPKLTRTWPEIDPNRQNMDETCPNLTKLDQMPTTTLGQRDQIWC